MIFANSIMLACYDYSDKSSSVNEIIDIFGAFFTVVFAIEALLKICAMGLVMHKKSYLREGWNIMDFLIVISG